MKHKHFQLRVWPEDGKIWLVYAAPRQPIKRIRDMTEETMWCLCADLSAANDGPEVVKALERSIVFSDGMECRVTTELVTLPSAEKEIAA